LKKKKTVGFYGGTFDPIHFGHINLAVQLLEIYSLDEVLFCPAYCSPLKTTAPPLATPHQRLEMVRIALEGIPHFRITTYEIDRNEPAFTIDTLQMIKREGRGDINFRLLLSEEAASHFDQWKNFQDLIRLAPPIIGTRSPSLLRGSLADSLRSGCTQTKIFEISSTDIRERLKKEQYCGHLVPEKVLDYIQANGLYKI